MNTPYLVTFTNDAMCLVIADPDMFTDAYLQSYRSVFYDLDFRGHIGQLAYSALFNRNRSLQFWEGYGDVVKHSGWRFTVAINDGNTIVGSATVRIIREGFGHISDAEIKEIQ